MSEKRHVFDKPRNVKAVLWFLYACCAVLLGCEYLIHKGHLHFSWEQWPEFYAVYGFLACAVLVLVAKWLLRPLVMRDEDYYD